MGQIDRPRPPGAGLDEGNPPARDGREDLDFGGKLITVRSENVRKDWIIDCQSSAAAGAGGGGLGLDAHPYLAIR